MFRSYYSNDQAKVILNHLFPMIKRLEQEAKTTLEQLFPPPKKSTVLDRKASSEKKLDPAELQRKEAWTQQLIQCQAIYSIISSNRHPIQRLTDLLILAKQRLDYFTKGASFETLENAELPLLYSIYLALITSMPLHAKIILDELHSKQIENSKHLESSLQEDFNEGKIFQHKFKSSLEETSTLTTKLCKYLWCTFCALEVDILKSKLLIQESRSDSRAIGLKSKR